VVTSPCETGFDRYFRAKFTVPIRLLAATDANEHAYHGGGATTALVGNVFDDQAGCHFEEVCGGQFTCNIFNELQPVDVVVEKERIDEHPEFLLPTFVEIRLECDGLIAGGSLVLATN
jgi:hypothetical protein